MKILNLEPIWEEGVILWIDKDSDEIIMKSIHAHKYGSTTQRVIMLKENTHLLSQFEYLSQVDSSVLNSSEENLIGAAIVNDKIIVQLNSGGNIYQLTRDYKEIVSKEKAQEIINQFEEKN